MEAPFIAALNILRPAPAYLRSFKAIVLDVWNAKRKDAVSTEAAIDGFSGHPQIGIAV